MNKKPLIVIFLTVFIDLIGFGIIIPLSPYLATEYGASAFEVGLLMAIYSLMQFIFAPIWGQLSDKYGRRPIILMSLLGASLAHLMFAFADSMVILFIARGFAGLFGANISTAMAYMADVTDEKSRSKNMGLIGAAFGLGFILGPAIGGFFSEVGAGLGSVPPFGQSFAAVVASGICFANFLFALKVLKESLKTPQTQRRPSRFKNIIDHFSQPTLGWMLTMYFLISLGMAQMEACLFLYVKDKFGWGVAAASYGFAYVGLIMVFTQGGLVRRLIPKMGEAKVLIGGLLLFGLGHTLIGFSNSIVLLAVAVTLLGLGNGLSMPAIQGGISLLTDESRQGSVMGVNQSLSALGRIIGPAIGGIFYDQMGWSVPFWVAGLLTFTALFMGIMIYTRIPNKGKAT